jgi:hypothetical protein
MTRFLRLLLLVGESGPRESVALRQDLGRDLLHGLDGLSEERPGAALPVICAAGKPLKRLIRSGPVT